MLLCAVPCVPIPHISHRARRRNARAEQHDAPALTMKEVRGEELREAYSRFAVAAYEARWVVLGGRGYDNCGRRAD